MASNAMPARIGMHARQDGRLRDHGDARHDGPCERRPRETAPHGSQALAAIFNTERLTIFCHIDIAHGNKAQPRRLGLPACRYRLVDQPGNRPTVQGRFGLRGTPACNVAERPAKQARIKPYGRSEVWRHQFDKDHFADVMFGADGRKQCRQLDWCGDPRPANCCAEQARPD